jgi:murein DD-endopeptidase MepM/ murein hydrolase activator NlpD
MSIDIVKTQFTELMVEANRFDRHHFTRWLFCPGMLFNSPDKWWGDHGPRNFPHEGLDFCLYEGPSGQIMRLDPNTRIPVMQDGVVQAMFADYLGQALIVEHPDARNHNQRCLSVYAHTKPLDGIEPGTSVKQGTVIATIADAGRSKSGILPHLHLSMGLASPHLSYGGFVWNHMRDPGLVALLDPVDIVKGQYKVLANCSDV